MVLPESSVFPSIENYDAKTKSKGEQTYIRDNSACMLAIFKRPCFKLVIIYTFRTHPITVHGMLYIEMHAQLPKFVVRHKLIG